MNLKEIRLARGMTQKEVADACGLGSVAYCYYENERRQPKPDTLKKLAAVFGCTVDALLEEKGEPDADDRN